MVLLKHSRIIRIISVGDSVVYWVIGDTFYTLYDFTKKSGEVVTIPAETEFNPANGNMLYVKIDSVKTENVAGENMLVQYVSSQGMIAFSGRITEKFGHTQLLSLMVIWRTMHVSHFIP